MSRREPGAEEARANDGELRASLLWRFVREPLVHFLFAGGALFLAYAALHPELLARDDSHRIVLTADDLRQIAVAWMAQGRPAPTVDEMRNLVDSRVREEMLYRESIALGLDQDDAIVRRRLAQKMEFLFEDVSALREPGPGELEDFLAKNPDRFATPARVTFRHLYFSPDRRGEHARDDATQALDKLAGQGLDADSASALADPFMFQDFYGDRTFEQVATSFGPAFAGQLFAAEPGSWRGPFQSGYGWHLVYVDSRTPSRTPPLSEMEADVRRAWMEVQRDDLKRRAFEEMLTRYDVQVPEDLTVPSLAAVGVASAPESP